MIDTKDEELQMSNYALGFLTVLAGIFVALIGFFKVSGAESVEVPMGTLVAGLIIVSGGVTYLFFHHKDESRYDREDQS
jgi:hypothetical protein